MTDAKRKAHGGRARARSRTRSRTNGTRWRQEGNTISTFAPPGTFSKDAEQIARIMASPGVSPKGLGSAIRMVQCLINRGGRWITAARRRELEKAKRLLQARASRASPRKP